MNAAKRQHTPGPWMASQAFFFGHDSWQITGTIGDTSPFLCRLMDDTPDYEANARLIASSPDLLAALESIAALEPSIMSKQAEEGFRFHAEEDAYRVHLAGLINQARAIARAAIAKATGGEE